MITLRCTRKLQRHLGVEPELEDREPTSALGDWYGNLVFLPDGPALVLVTNERSLISVLVSQDEELLPALRRRVIRLLRRLDVPKPAVEREIFHLQQVRIGKTKNRRVLGTMNDVAWQLEGMLLHNRRGPVSQDQAEDYLGQVPFSVIDYRFPEDVARELLGAPPRTKLRAVELHPGGLE